MVNRYIDEESFIMPKWVLTKTRPRKETKSTYRNGIEALDLILTFLGAAEGNGLVVVLTKYIVVFFVS